MTSIPADRETELADVVHVFRQEYTSRFGDVMLPSQKKAISDIVGCMTAMMGGRRFRCDDCEHSFWAYHSCRNRSCPKCHGRETRRWLEAKSIELLPCPYFHLVATVPEELRPFFLKDQKFMYSLLMKTVASSLITLTRDPKYIGATPAILAVLHTWTTRMMYHPHVHLLISAGGVSDDGTFWHEANRSFLVPVKALSKIIAARFRDTMKKERPDEFKQIGKGVWKKSWCSFCVPYGTGNKAVLNYLARYVFRIAITNHRIIAMTETDVTFRYKDRENNKTGTMTLGGVEFLRRFLMHVLPRGFHKVRYYGLWHPGKRNMQITAKLLLILNPVATPKVFLLASEIPAKENRETPDENIATFRTLCPRCGGEHLTLLAEIPRGLPRRQIPCVTRGDPETNGV